MNLAKTQQKIEDDSTVDLAGKLTVETYHTHICFDAG